MFTIDVVNIGAVRLHQVSLTVPQWTELINCSDAAAKWTIQPFEKVTCLAKHEFTQDTFEQGDKSFVASATADELEAAVASSTAVTVATLRTVGWTFTSIACVLPNTSEYCSHVQQQHCSRVCNLNTAALCPKLRHCRICHGCLLQPRNISTNWNKTACTY